MAFVKVAEISGMKDGQAKVLNAAGKAIALYRANGRYYATANECPHQGGPLGEGVLSSKVITCPLHGWKFNVETGACENIPAIHVKTYNVKTENGNVMVDAD